MKKLLVSLLLVSGMFVANAASLATVAVTASSTNSILTQAASISQLTIANSGTNAVLFKLFDSGSSALVIANGAYSVYSNYVANVTNTVVSSTGTTNTYIYTDVILRATNTIAAATNSCPVLGTFVVPAGDTLVVPFTDVVYGIRGLTTTNSAPGGTAVLTINYSNLR